MRGRNVKPGEISLAHNGVLFLDEIAEFPRGVLDSLRQPLEAKKITVSRVNNHVTYPAAFQLIAAMNPCKCGYFGDAGKECNKAPNCARDYQSKISGPILDRIDICVEINRTKMAWEGYDETEKRESSETIAQRVSDARKVQSNRYANYGSGVKLNRDISGKVLEIFCLDKLTSSALDLFKEAAEKFSLSMRGHDKSLRVARTIADMENSDEIKREHIAESLSYRHVMIVR